MSWPLHGSNPHYIYEFLEIPMPQKIIDFSVNLNPFGPPPSIKENWSNWLSAVEDYPDPNGKALIEQISEKEGLPETSVLLGNGGAEMIALVARMLAGKRVLLIQPTFAEYGRMCEAYGCQIIHWVLPEGSWGLEFAKLTSIIRTVDAVFLCHPNNPTGVVYPNDLLLKIAHACKVRDCLLIVDEAFYDFLADQQTIASLVDNNTNLIVIRSLTKMYSIAGLRLGYLLAEPEIVQQLTHYQAHWSVNALALLAGQECLHSDDYVNRTRAFISGERGRITDALQQAGYLVSESMVNFYLLRDPELDEQLPLFTFLLKKGLVPRHTANYQGLNGRWMRFAIRKAWKNDVLLEALLEWKTSD